jgi:(E)-4-hydroxy-3-methylbut-2-enyl-diphosphate synthase
MSNAATPPYCASRQATVRRRASEVRIGALTIGGDRPLAVQSMTTTPTEDVAATVDQCIALAAAGCEIVRVTAQTAKIAACLGPIRQAFSAAGFAAVPLVADIHFHPQAAMQAALHVEKVRINPGNYADRKKFQVREYSDSEYNAELERLHAAFTPLVLRCRELGRALRVGTNHGSLSDRILNRYGDTPLGMCESALEFLRIARAHGFHDLVISMKASNPKVAIQAYRLIVARMAAEDMHYPLHLGVTEAGDGDDARIKSAIGIGGLLWDGLGDTLRVSLTEDPVAEVPVAKALAARAGQLWRAAAPADPPHPADPIDPYRFARRAAVHLACAGGLQLGPPEPPRVIQPLRPPAPGADPAAALPPVLADTPVEAVLVAAGDPHVTSEWIHAVRARVPCVVWDGCATPTPPAAAAAGDIVVLTPGAGTEPAILRQSLAAIMAIGALPCIDSAPDALPALLAGCPEALTARCLFTISSVNAPEDGGRRRQPAAIGALPRAATADPGALPRAATADPDALPRAATADPGALPRAATAESGVLVTVRGPDGAGPSDWRDDRRVVRGPDGAGPSSGCAGYHAGHAVGAYRALAATLQARGLRAPIWIRCTAANAVGPLAEDGDALLDAAILAGALLCDGIGDLLSVETVADPRRAVELAYAILQGARCRVSKAEFVACPSCGRTLFDLQSTTQRIRAATGHLKGVTIAVMGCIVNGPGEMADADFGYVGGAPGKVNLYVGHKCVRLHIPSAQAVDALIALIKAHDRWQEPPAAMHA